MCSILSIHAHVFTGLCVYALCGNFLIGYINNNIKYSDYLDVVFSLIIHIFSLLDFKPSLCWKCCILSFGRFPIVFIGHVDTTYEDRTGCS